MVEVLAIIQARGGSKSIPDKNIKLLGGYPLVAYSVAAGIQAKSVTRTIISTDSQQIADVAAEYGAEVPFLRPDELATDTAVDLDLFVHALAWLAEHEDYHPDYVVQLRPTSPFRSLNCVDDAVNILHSNPQADCVRGVVETLQTPYKMWRVPHTEQPMQPLLQDEFEEPYNMPRQQLPSVYWQTGHIDAIRTQTIMQKKSMTGDRIFPSIISPDYMIDIDTENDWHYAEWTLERRNLEIVTPL